MSALTKAWQGIWHREEADEPLGPLWLLIGPISLTLSLLLAYGARHYDLIAVGLLGLMASSFGYRRVLFALLLLAVSIPLGHLLHPDAHVWRFGLECSIGIAFWITAVAIEDSEMRRTQLSFHLTSKEATLQTLQEETTARIVSLQERLDTLQEKLTETETEKASILTLNEVLRHTTAQEAKERDELAESLDQMRIEQVRLRSIPDMSQKVAELEGQIAHLQERQMEAASARAELRQLRRQFEEKDAHLHDARSQLFRMEARYEAFHRSVEMAALDRNPIEEKMGQELSSLAREQTLLVEENELLADLVTELLSEAPARKKKVTKKSSTNQELPF